MKCSLLGTVYRSSYCIVHLICHSHILTNQSVDQSNTFLPLNSFFVSIRYDIDRLCHDYWINNKLTWYSEDTRRVYILHCWVINKWHSLVLNYWDGINQGTWASKPMKEHFLFFFHKVPYPQCLVVIKKFSLIFSSAKANKWCFLVGGESKLYKVTQGNNRPWSSSNALMFVKICQILY